VDKVKMVYIMGGAFDVSGNIALSNVGIDNTVAEWNVFIDPRAAAVVLKSGIPVTFVPLDATNQAPIAEDFYNRLGKERSTPATEFVYRLLTSQFDMIRAGLFWFWDPLTAVISTDESLGSFTERSVAVVEEEGPESGGTHVTENGSPVRITTTVDPQRFETLFLDVLNGRFYGTTDPIQ
jgi:pyrimidine-specific ribonucleoside hydrolase